MARVVVAVARYPEGPEVLLLQVKGMRVGQSAILILVAQAVVVPAVQVDQGKQPMVRMAV